MWKYGLLMMAMMGLAVTASAEYQFKFEPTPIVDSLKGLEKQPLQFRFEVLGNRSFLQFKIDPSINVIGESCLSFTLDAPVPGRVTLFYRSSDGALVNIDARIMTVPGRQEYEIDLSKQRCGKEYRSKEIPEYQKFGAVDGKISGLRIDFWFPKQTVLTVSNVKLGKPAPQEKK